MRASIEARIEALERRLVDTSTGADAGLRARMAHYAVPGAAFALIVGGEIVLSAGTACWRPGGLTR